MVGIFLKLLNISFSASLLIAACILIRYAFKSMPKYMRCILWVLVLVRLVCPIRLESSFSLLPQKDAISFADNDEADIKADNDLKSYVMTKDDSVSDGKIRTLILANTNGEEGVSAANVQTKEVGSAVGTESDSKIKKADILMLLSVIWIIGIFVSLAYGLAAYLRLIRCVDDAVRLKENIYQSDRVATPFVLGIFRTRIYIPYNLSAREMYFVLSHERAHISRKDHMLKPAAYLISCIYWFNPLIWISYMLLCRDIELACDEKAIRRIGYNNKKEYSQSILDLSVPRKYISACPVAFGETGVKERVKSVLNMKKGTKIAAIISAVLIVIVGVGFLTYPKNKKNDNKKKTAASVTEATTEQASELSTEEDIEKAEASTEDKQSPTEASKADTATDSNDAIREIVSKIVSDDSIGGDGSDVRVTLVNGPADGAVSVKSEDPNHEYSFYMDEDTVGENKKLVIFSKTVKEDGNEVKVVTAEVQPYEYGVEEDPEEASVEVDGSVVEADPIPEESTEYIDEDAPQEVQTPEGEEVPYIEPKTVDDAGGVNTPYTIKEIYGLEDSDILYICNDCQEKLEAEDREIKSVISGTVESCGYDKESGNYVEIKDEAGNVYKYCHLQDQSSFKEQDAVKEGEVIGKIRNKGKALGPTLQITVTDKNGKTKNIQIYLAGFLDESDEP